MAATAVTGTAQDAASTGATAPGNARGALAALGVLLLFATLLRWRIHGGVTFTPWDETWYLNWANAVAYDGIAGFRASVRLWLDTGWFVPRPTRWGHVLLGAAACRLGGSCGFEQLAALSMLAGVVAVGATYLLAATLIARPAAVLAASFTAVSALDLGLGRRAMQDEVVLATALLALYAVARSAQRPASWRGTLATILALTVALAVKESFVVMLPVVLVLRWSAERPLRITATDVALVTVPPLLFLGGLFVLSGNGLFREAVSQLVTQTVVGTQAGSPVSTVQGGPPWRLLVDLIALNPIVTAAALGGLGAVVSLRRVDGERGAVVLAAAIALSTVALALGTRNARIWVTLNALHAILAAWVFWRVIERRVPRWRWTAIACIAAINALVCVSIYRRVFGAHPGEADAVTLTVLRGLGMIP